MRGSIVEHLGIRIISGLGIALGSLEEEGIELDQSPLFIQHSLQTNTQRELNDHFFTLGSQNNSFDGDCFAIVKANPSDNRPSIAKLPSRQSDPYSRFGEFDNVIFHIVELKFRAICLRISESVELPTLV